MKIATTIPTLRDALGAARATGRRIAFVPTMGALHEGHLVLVDEARKRADVVVVSIFVNPLQFGPNEDLARYPRTLDADTEALRQRGASVIFAPSPAEMYKEGRMTTITAAPNDAQYEGAIRPGHFDGVLTVVAKLFNIVQPDVACFGQKDIQQLSLVKQMVRDLDFPVDIATVPTVREPDGLAMSSRNRYLTESDRQRAARLYGTLQKMRSAFGTGIRESSDLLAMGFDVLKGDQEIVVDYLDVVDTDTFLPVTTVVHGNAIIMAARIGDTRLIDNLIL